MYEIAVPWRATIGLELHLAGTGGLGGLTIYLIAGFDARNGHRRARKLQMWVRRLVQLLRLAYLRAGESRALEVDDPVIEPGRWRPGLEERP